MGAVYVVEQLSTRAQRALKLMHPELVRDASLRARFEQEAKIASQVPSDHVVQVIAAGVDDATGMPWLAMELLDGTDLLEAAATGRAGPAVLREIMTQLCHALGAAHERGIVHRDLKPENIFLAAPRRAGIPFTVKVLDFGISKLTSQAHSASATASLGTPLWMAPEQAGASSGQISPATDVWAMGLIAFWLLTGRHYWLGARDENTTLQAIMREVLFDPIAPASERAAQVSSDARLPTGFDMWFAKTVQRDPTQRFANASVAGAELEKALAPAEQPAPKAAAKAAVAHTVDDMPPLRIDTPPAPPPPVPAPQMVQVPQVRPEWITPGPQPRISPVPPTPAPHYPSPYAAPGFAPNTGAPWASTPAVPYAPTGSFQTEPRQGWGCLAWLIVATIGAVGLIAAAFFTRDAWEPTLLGYLGEEPAEVPAPPAATVAAEVACPQGTRRSGQRCIKVIDETCPPGMRFTKRGCVALLPPDAGKKPGGVTITSKPRMSTLRVNCNPSCDRVYIDHKPYGRSPVTVRLPAGKHSIRREKAGYVTRRSTITLRSGRPYTSTRSMTRSGPPPPKPSTGTKGCDCTKTLIPVPCIQVCAAQRKK